MLLFGVVLIGRSKWSRGRLLGSGDDDDIVGNLDGVLSSAVFCVLGGAMSTSRKQGFGSGLTNPLVPVQLRTENHGGIRPGSCARGPAGPRRFVWGHMSRF